MTNLEINNKLASFIWAVPVASVFNGWEINGKIYTTCPKAKDTPVWSPTTDLNAAYDVMQFHREWRYNIRKTIIQEFSVGQLAAPDPFNCSILIWHVTLDYPISSSRVYAEEESLALAISKVTIQAIEKREKWKDEGPIVIKGWGFEENNPNKSLPSVEMVYDHLRNIWIKKG